MNLTLYRHKVKSFEEVARFAVIRPKANRVESERLPKRVVACLHWRKKDKEA
jgi:hypothetical protein